MAVKQTWQERRREYLEAIGARELTLIDVKNGRKIRVKVIRTIDPPAPGKEPAK